jgi:hypothetical protein
VQGARERWHPATVEADLTVADQIIQAMRAARSRRLVVVSAALVGSVPSPGRPHPPKHDLGDGFFMRHLLSPIATAMQREHMADLAVMEDIVRDSDLDWTVTRPAQLSDSRSPASTEQRTDAISSADCTCHAPTSPTSRSSSPARSGKRSASPTMKSSSGSGLAWWCLRASAGR